MPCESLWGAFANTYPNADAYRNSKWNTESESNGDAKGNTEAAPDSPPASNTSIMPV